MEPEFRTYKIKVEPLCETINVFDYQLRDHAINIKNLYVLSIKE